LQHLLKEYRLSLPTPEDELQDLKGRLLVNCLVLCSRRLLSYEKATVTRQKEYAWEQLTGVSFGGSVHVATRHYPSGLVNSEYHVAAQLSENGG
jgi:hypothetical protein